LQLGKDSNLKVGQSSSQPPNSIVRDEGRTIAGDDLGTGKGTIGFTENKVKRYSGLIKRNITDE
jgi:hypothetical protein